MSLLLFFFNIGRNDHSIINVNGSFVKIQMIFQFLHIGAMQTKCTASYFELRRFNVPSHKVKFLKRAFASKKCMRKIGQLQWGANYVEKITRRLLLFDLIRFIGGIPNINWFGS